MSIGIVQDNEFEIELERLQGKMVPSISSVIVEKPTKGRDNGDMNVPDPLRQIIGEEAVINGRQSALHLAKEFGISASSVSAYAKGATSTTTYDSPKASIISHINKSRKRAIVKAGNTLNAALGSITQEKLDYADAKDLAVIAKSMSAVIKDLEPQQSMNEVSSSTPQFVIYAPQFRSENSFEVIQVKE